MEIMFAIPRHQESKHVSSPLIVIYDRGLKIYQQQKSLRVYYILESIRNHL